MIHYALRCEEGHEFDGWYASASAFDRLSQAGHVTCTVCGDARVARALMAPAVKTGPKTELTTPRSEIEKELAALRRKLETESDYVGLSFVSEVRAMHEGRAPERAVWGEAKPDEARALIEEGIPVAPLPFLPKARAN